ncbi:Choline/ethanolamine kinase [Dictyocaulus viviparus]|uniref:ethanolamine kinase n=1 Tax=Dictyocaulus viviparus TaxID=29172 RepID=A0A0D8XKL3_DICVI|nr:Choline/ethanolamine kinase [Dictyocaulus viviparus]
MNVPFLNVQLPITGCIRNDNSVLEIIRAVRPQWKTKSIQFELYTAGITNKIFSAFVDSSDKLIFRVFGRNTEHFIDREKELEAMEKLYKNHLAAPLYARFINGIVCGYLPGSTISIDDLKNPHIQKKICSTIAAYHNMDGVPIRNDKNLFPFRKIRDFIGNIGDRASSEQIDFINELPNHLEEIQSLVLPLEEEITFCHNDLLVHNILFDPISEQVRFLDYEYADYNYAIFDLANHFCEYAGVENPDYSRCPNERYRREFLRMYLEERFGKVDDNRLNQLTERCVLFQALAHLLWSSWSIVQSQNSTLDFDYISYARLRYDQYLKLMKELKSSNKETIKTKDC